MTGVPQRLDRVRQAIADAAAGRGEQVTLVAVTKTVAPDRIAAAYEAGQRVFGENRVQEAAEKIRLLAPSLPDARWHLIGHLQTNKARVAVSCFSLIESVDSLRLARRLETEASRTGRRLPVLVEVNVAGEATKGGFDPDELARSFSDLQALDRLELRGLMTVAPPAEDPEDVRWVFRRLRELRDDLRDRFDLQWLTELSMGMSDDYQVAISEGATMVRLGRAIFGERPET